jgi:hypothetical protein
MATLRREEVAGIARCGASAEEGGTRETESTSNACRSQGEALLAGTTGAAGASDTGDSTQHEHFAQLHARKFDSLLVPPLPADEVGGRSSIRPHSRIKMARANFTVGAVRFASARYLALGASESFLR